MTLYKVTEQRTKILRYLLGLIYYSNNTYSELAGKWNHLVVLRAQMQRRSRQILSRLIFVCAYAGFLYSQTMVQDYFQNLLKVPFYSKNICGYHPRKLESSPLQYFETNNLISLFMLFSTSFNILHVTIIPFKSFFPPLLTGKIILKTKMFLAPHKFFV